MSVEPDAELQYASEHPNEWLQELEQKLDGLSSKQQFATLEKVDLLVDDWLRREAILLMIPMLDDANQAYVREMANRTSNMSSQLLIMARLCRHWKGEERQALIQDTWVWWQGNTDDWAKVEALRDLAGLLSHSEVLSALDVVNNMADEFSQVQGRMALIDVVDEKLRGQLLADTLETAYATPDYNRAGALLAVIPVLQGVPREAAIKAAHECIMQTEANMPVDSNIYDLTRLLLLVDDATRAEYEQDLPELLQRMEGDGEGLVRVAYNYAQLFSPAMLQAFHAFILQLEAQAVRDRILIYLQPLLEQKQVQESTPAPKAKGQPVTEPTPEPPPPMDDAVPTHADDPARVDQLERRPFAEVLVKSINDIYRKGVEAEAAADDDKEAGRAYIVHIHGPWGSGKSSILNFMRDELQNPQDEGQPAWVVIDFNAWRHQNGGPPWWPLMNAIARQAFSYLSLKKPLNAFLLGWHNWWWNMRMSGGISILAMLVLMWLVFLGIKHSKLFTTANADDILDFIALTLTVGGVLLGVFRSLFHGSSENAKLHIQMSRNPMQPLIRHFARMVKTIGSPVAIFIDDLDRCDGDYVVELLQGIQTLFRISNVTYVVAADRDWLRASYETRYEDYCASIGDVTRPLGYLFLEKVFQVSVSIPRLAPRVRDHYLRGLLLAGEGPILDAQQSNQLKRDMEAEFERLGSEEARAQKLDELANRPMERRIWNTLRAKQSISPQAQARDEYFLQYYAEFMEHNPRSMKRLVNAFGFQKSVSILSEHHLDQHILALWIILSTRWPRVADFLGRHPEVADKICQVMDTGFVDQEAALFADPMVSRVIRGKYAGRQLNSASVRQLTGRDGEISVR